jgi:UDP-3-O-[3-hydroxymyristoyl] N-acetylglucosamine deacetylase
MGFITDHVSDDLKQIPFETQRTLKGPISCVGVGLHSGVKVPMTLRPAEADTGIRFRRVDLAGGGALIPARWDHVVETRLRTTLGNADGVSLATVEHLMAAFAGCGIDNAEIEVNGPEVPVMEARSLSSF